MGVSIARSSPRLACASMVCAKYVTDRIFQQLNKTGYTTQMFTGTPRRRSTSLATKKADPLPEKLPHLCDQVAASAMRHRQLEGSALWVLLAMYRAFAVLDRDQVAEVSAMGLTTLQFNILNILERAGEPMTMGALASLLVVQPNNLSSNFSALSDKGYVRRELNQNDHRSLLAVLTPEGQAFLNDKLPGHWERLEELMKLVSREERVSLVNLLKKLATSIQIAEPAGSTKKAAAAKALTPKKRANART